MKKYLLFILILVIFCTLIGCGSTRPTTQLVRDVHTDTLFIQDRTVEYRYRLLRDTVYRTRIDSIPVIRAVEVIREVRHIPWWSRLLNWIGALAMIILLIRVLRVIRG